MPRMMWSRQQGKRDLGSRKSLEGDANFWKTHHHRNRDMVHREDNAHGARMRVGVSLLDRPTDKIGADEQRRYVLPSFLPPCSFHKFLPVARARARTLTQPTPLASFFRPPPTLLAPESPPRKEEGIKAGHAEKRSNPRSQFPRDICGQNASKK